MVSKYVIVCYCKDYIYYRCGMYGRVENSDTDESSPQDVILSRNVVNFLIKARVSTVGGCDEVCLYNAPNPISTYRRANVVSLNNTVLPNIEMTLGQT